MNVDLRYLRYFIAVAEELHFTRAAKRLNMSQPPLSQIINRLEDQLGFKLFERTKRKVLLTEAGAILLEEGRTILARAESAVQHAKRAAHGDIGHLKVAFIPWADFTTSFSAVFRAFGERHPDVTVDFHSMPAPASLLALAEGRIDLAFLSAPPNPPVGISHELVLSDSIVVALPEHHPLARKSVAPLKSVAAQPQIAVAHDRIGSYFDLIETLYHRSGINIRARHVIDHPQTTLTLVAAGVGVALVPASYANVPRRGVVYRPIRPTIEVKLIVAWKSETSAAVTRRFLDVLRDVTKKSAAPKRRPQSLRRRAVPA
jgi:DNA-binding transcriptional LysR family regulator